MSSPSSSLLDRQRLAERRRYEALIAANPAFSRFRDLAPNVLLSDPMRGRAMRAGGFDPSIVAECILVLPEIEKPPQPENEVIEIRDWSAQVTAYTIATVTPLRGLACYKLGLRARRGKPKPIG